jgi:hypothetical protein
MGNTRHGLNEHERRKKFGNFPPFIDCPTKKVPYCSERIAKQYASTSSKRFGGATYPYRCPHCRTWHLTKQHP